jgi:dipeptidase
VRLALERASSAREAVEVIVTLLERYGQGGACGYERTDFRYHNSFLVADPRGAIVLETAGRHWATEVVNGRGRSISNGLTIPGFAEKFARTAKGRVVGCELRRALTQSGAERAVGPTDLFALLRSHGETRTPQWSPLHGSLRAPCVHFGGVIASSQTTGSLVVDLRDGVRAWATGTSAPCLSVFKPVSVDQPIDVGGLGGDRVDDTVLWWRHEQLHRQMIRDYSQFIGSLAPERDALERALVLESSAVAFAKADELAASWHARWDSAVDQRPQFVQRRAAQLELLARR